ncbi:MAG: MBL fold metallo-hydrolase [Gammaproteobacteria bacterium]|nr:MBL fold metallo-hydrolase [Gammaproteobacteria bacterium]
MFKNIRSKILQFSLLIAGLSASSSGFAVTPTAEDLVASGQIIQVSPQIYMTPGYSNTMMIITTEGVVIIDTSSADQAQMHYDLLKAVSSDPVRYIILTHGHGDHRGGISLWREEGTQLVAQANYSEFLHYSKRLNGFFAERNKAQAGVTTPLPAGFDPNPGNYAATIDANIMFEDFYSFSLGGLTFELHHTPGETYDQSSVWIPELKAAFVGDNFYNSFPNMYTLRGTKPRWALDYVTSLEKIMAWQPELVIPSHGDTVVGSAQIQFELSRYRDSILYVHDAVVAGMNAGKNVYTLMQEIKLPADLDVGESYGRVTWSIRGIYEGYAGWFDGNPSNMYALPPWAADSDLVAIAGVAAVIDRAKARLRAGEILMALRLADAVLHAAPNNVSAWGVRLTALKILYAKSTNSNERSWLKYGINEASTHL